MKKIISLPLHKPVRGLIARIAIQCVCPDTGETGCFLYSGESHKTKQSRLTPVFPDLADLFIALPKMGWQQAANVSPCCAYVFSPISV